jgi:hypothetical protein
MTFKGRVSINTHRSNAGVMKMLSRRSFLASGAAAAAASLAPGLQGQEERHKQETAQPEGPRSKAITKVFRGRPLALGQVKASG